MRRRWWRHRPDRGPAGSRFAKVTVGGLGEKVVEFVDAGNGIDGNWVVRGEGEWRGDRDAIVAYAEAWTLDGRYLGRYTFPSAVAVEAGWVVKVSLTVKIGEPIMLEAALP